MRKDYLELDRIDRHILATLQREGRVANVELARRVHLSPTPCLERVKRLEREGFILNYVALCNPAKLNIGLVAYIEVSLTSTTTADLQRFNEQMRQLPEVQECQMVAGGFDYLVKIRVSDMEHYQHFLGEKLAVIPGISQTHTYMVIQEIKSETAIPVPEEQ